MGSTCAMRNTKLARVKGKCYQPRVVWTDSPVETTSLI